MIIGYVAVERFIPPQSYYDWCELYHVKEVVSFDVSLCHRIIEYIEDDYEQMIWMTDESYWVYKDVDWLIRKLKNRKDIQILALAREPERECSNALSDERFHFYGYDLIEDMTNISALTNCGGFDKAFRPDDVSIYGLIEDFSKAKEIQKRLLMEYPYENHAACAIWAIWRMDT